ncbi:MAG: Fe(3+) ABC transporter substrate-binding protein [Candidatus Marinimicrobia bacterium]|nr:Fe(3+) ABC transporter substrate-binding protein [Candidatus Neomarinimicrobiota bacterium]
MLFKTVNKLIILVCITCFVMADINVYTHRHYDSDKILFKRFTDITGIKVNVIKGSADQLIQRLKSEGKNSPADILLTVDAGRLVKAKELGLLQSVSSTKLLKNVPEIMRDNENQWFGLSVRARVIVYAKDKVKENELSTYEDLADPKWKGRIVVRSSNNIYNQSLMASLIESNGSENALKWAKAIRNNMARKPRGNDRDQARAVASGVADLAIINTYYLGLLANSSDKNDRKVAKKLKVFFPNQNGRGTHINVSGGAVTASSKNKGEAIRFLEFLTENENQKIFSESNYEYPLDYWNTKAKVHKKWGKFKGDSIHLSILGNNNADAVKIFDLAGWE